MNKLRVLWATDGSGHSLSAIPIIQDLILPATERLVVLSVAPQSVVSGARPDPAFLGVTGKVRERALADAVMQAEADLRALHAGQTAAECISLWGNPIQQILQTARRDDADLIVVGAKGHSNLGLLLLGSVAQGVVQHADRPVLVTRPGNTGIDSLLIGYDGSSASRRGLQFLKRLVIPREWEVVLNHVVAPFAVPTGTPVAYREAGIAAAQTINNQRHRRAERGLQAAVKDLASAGIEAEPEVLAGVADLELEASATRRGADLIVVGSRKPLPSRHYLLGSTAEKLVRHASVSVLVVR